MTKRRFTKANVNFLSLCKRGKNRLPVIYKAEGEVLDLDMLLKADKDFNDNGELTAIVYAPEFRDRDGDIASADVIKKAMYDASRKGVGIDIRHNEVALAKDKVFIAENFIVQKNDPRFDNMKDYDGNAVDVTGAWAVVLKVEDAELRKSYREDGWNGISMAGTAAVVVEKSDTADQVVKLLAELIGKPKLENADMPMTKEEKDELAATIAVAVAKAVVEVKPVVTVVKEDADEAPIFKGDKGDIKAIKAHRINVKKYELRKSADLTTDEGIEAYEKALEEFNASLAPVKVEKTDREKELEAELAQIRKGSNQAVEGNREGTAKVTITKEETQSNIGKSMAEIANKRRGYVTK